MAAFIGVVSVTGAGWSAWLPDASEFYIVSIGFSDAAPGWHHSVLEVRPDGGDVLVRYIRVIPFSVDCGEAARIVTASARLQHASLASITGGVNLCAIDPWSLSRTLQKFPDTRGTRAFAGDHFSIAAKCGTDTNVVRLPGDWTVDMAGLKRQQPKIAALWALESAIGTQAFGSFPSIDVVPAEMAARLEPAGEAILAGLKSGKFDAGFAPRSFKDDVAMLRSGADAPGHSVHVKNADQLHFDRYVEPPYPPLARQARMSGTVELELAVNSTTGKTERVTVIAGHPLLAPAAKEAALDWRFVRGTPLPTRVSLEFVFRCP
ncbi:MAG TPA: energy transducer TonB [Bryobacteraceae bacterium]|nr:energy transducer TonB [Bryobacteraceae bacterium]